MIFEQAKKLISPAIIQQYFGGPGSYLRNNEFYCLSPLRADNSIGTFSINIVKNTYFDFSTKEKGDIIDLVAKSRGLSLVDAAKDIIKSSGGNLPDFKHKNEPKKEKPKAVLPIPNEVIEDLKKTLDQAYYINTWGKRANGWTHYDENGGMAFVVVRHIKDKISADGSRKEGKQDIPYYYTIEKKWRQGYPPQIENNLPLYNLNKLSDWKGPILLVEGQKCASIEVPGFLSITWAGGCGGFKRSDWSVLKDRDVIIWPDHDLQKDTKGELIPDEKQPGLKAAIAIRDKYLKKAKILKIDSNFSGWDIADANNDKINLEKFINDCDRIDTKREKKEKIETPGGIVPPFKFLGYDQKFHYFLPENAPIPIAFTRGGLSRSSMLEMAPLAWWLSFFGNDAYTNINEMSAKDWLIQSSQRKGYYNPDLIRGSGVWRDRGRIVINNGSCIISHNGDTFSFNEFDSDYIYILSQSKMGDFDSEVSTDEDGKNLLELFSAQMFDSELGFYAAMGWSLIAPFSSFLSWRPPLWVIGPGSSGKSYLLENIMLPLAGQFCFNGSGRDTESGVRRSIGQNGMPAIMDEMEPRTPEARKRMDGQIELVRNGTSDSSSSISISNSSGGVDRFRIRSLFAFSSIIPYMDGAAIESRFTLCRLLSLNKNKFDLKKKLTIELMNKGVLDNTQKYRQRIFHSLPIIDENIKFLRKYFFHKTGNQRLADNMAPYFSAIFCVMVGGKIEGEVELLEKYTRIIMGSIEIKESDEDLLMREIFDSTIKDLAKEYTIGDLINSCARYNESNDNEDNTKNQLLQRYGIKVIKEKGLMHISKNNKQMKKILQDTFYSARYGEILSRHPCINSSGVNVRISSTIQWAVTFDLQKILDRYFNEKKESEIENRSNESLPF